MKPAALAKPVYRNFFTSPARAAVCFINLSCLCTAIGLQSRSFTIGYTLSALFIWLAYKNFKVSKQHLCIAVFSILLFGSLLSVYLKTDSSLGRLLIYKLSCSILADHYLHGAGWGQFPQVYGNYQAQYFKDGIYTTKELLLADNTKHAFNDYLQFTIETGAAGLALLISAAGAITVSIMASLKKQTSYPGLLILAISQITAVSAAALFMHVFEKPGYQCLFTAAIIIILYYAYFDTYRIYNCWGFVLLSALCLVGSHYGFYLKNYTKYQELQEAKELALAGYSTEALAHYKSLYPHLKRDIHFLNEYAALLNTLNYSQDAERVMEMIVKKDNASLFYSRLAECYFINGKVKKAEAAYLRAIYTVPNRFTPRYALFNLYFKIKQHSKALVTGKAILNLPVKVSSFQVSYIKKSVTETLKNNHRHAGLYIYVSP